MHRGAHPVLVERTYGAPDVRGAGPGVFVRRVAPGTVPGSRRERDRRDVIRPAGPVRT